jgi:drug/metabolite transporter (DMT)-like permease
VSNLPASGPDAATPSTGAAVGPTLGPVEYGLICLQSMLWGSMFFFIGIANGEIPPWTMSALRLGAALLVLTLFLRVRLPASLTMWSRFVILSFFNNALPFWFIARGQQEVTGGIAAIFNATAPLFTIVLAHFALGDERLSWRRVIGVLLGLCGIGVLTGLGGSVGSIGAQAQLLAAAACYAVGNVYGRKFLVGFHPVSMAVSQMLCACLITLSASVLFERPWEISMPSQKALLATLAMGIFGSALASLCHFTVLKRAGAINAILVTIILPVTPILLGYLFLGEHVSLGAIGGAGIIASALVIIDGRLVRRPLGAKI